MFNDYTKQMSDRSIDKPQLFEMAGTAGIFFQLSVVHMIKNWWFSDLFRCIYLTSLYDQILQLYPGTFVK